MRKIFIYFFAVTEIPSSIGREGSVILQGNTDLCDNSTLLRQVKQSFLIQEILIFTHAFSVTTRVEKDNNDLFSVNRPNNRRYVLEHSRNMR